MTHQKNRTSNIFDAEYRTEEQLPRHFTISFKEVGVGKKGEVRVLYNEQKQVGDIINDNAYENDFYRYHDIFHYTFAAMLGWSPCTRAMLKCKRKSNPHTDEIEDGARAAVTEEALSMILFNEAKKNNYFLHSAHISKTSLKIIKDMTAPFEARSISEDEWQMAILKAYEVFRFLIENKGGKVEFDANNKKVTYISLN